MISRNDENDYTKNITTKFVRQSASFVDGNEQDTIGSTIGAMFDKLEIVNPDDVNEDKIEETIDQKHENEEEEDDIENEDILQVGGEFDPFALTDAFDLGKDQLKKAKMDEMREKKKKNFSPSKVSLILI